MQMLLLMIRYDFSPLITERASRSYLKRLSSVKLKYEGRVETMEVIPYEVLWKSVLKQLVRKK